jgi:hypothetical protein
MIIIQPSSSDNKVRRPGSLCLDAALDYLRRGWSALCLCPAGHEGIPPGHARSCRRPGKVPLHAWKDYQERLPSDKELTLYFRRWPQANVGIALGPVSGLWGLDSDGEGGERLLGQMAQGDLPETLEFTTGKGRRLLFAWPAGLDLPNEEYGFGAQGEARVLGKGRQTVMPPTRRGRARSLLRVDTSTTCLRHCRFPPADQRPGRRHRSPERAGDVPLGGRPGEGPGRVLGSNGAAIPPHRPTPGERAAAYLDNSEECVQGEDGDGRCFKLAIHMVRGFCLDVETAVALMLHSRWNTRGRDKDGCPYPFTEKELRHKCEDAKKVPLRDGKQDGYLLNSPLPRSEGGLGINSSASTVQRAIGAGKGAALPEVVSADDTADAPS